MSPYPPAREVGALLKRLSTTMCVEDGASVQQLGGLLEAAGDVRLTGLGRDPSPIEFVGTLCLNASSFLAHDKDKKILSQAISPLALVPNEVWAHLQQA